MKPYITSILLFLFSSISAQITINARIISDKKVAVPYATIAIKDNTAIGAYSDVDGWFNLRCHENDSLIVRSVGYKTNCICAGDALRKKVIEIKEGTITLGEISISAETVFTDQN